MMTKRSYELVAEAIRNEREHTAQVYDKNSQHLLHVADAALMRFAKRLATSMHETNKAFNMKRFMAACTPMSPTDKQQALETLKQLFGEVHDGELNNGE